ncbi:MAG: hypothetical protein AAGE52_24145 [Myxococcota bacterium]
MRGRHDRRTQQFDNPYEVLERWLETSTLAHVSDPKLKRLDLTYFLGETTHVDLPAEERLRQLAIFLEPRASEEPFAVDRIYEAALRLEPCAWQVWESRGITAKHVAELRSERTEDHFRALSLRSLFRAWALAADGGTAYLLGKWHYEFGTLDEASAWFERATALDPNHGFAWLYRAHCLHDQQCWRGAVVAYRKVPLSYFVGPRSFYVDIVAEAQAYCRLRAGDREGALADFRRLIDRFEREPHRALILSLRWLDKACRGPLRDDLCGRYSDLRRVIDA